MNKNTRIDSHGIRTTPFDFSLTDSLVLKGVALLLLLWHHLFFIQRGLYDDIMIGEYGIVNESGCVAKVCVALFVLLSGYGLTVQYKNKPLVVKDFFKRRFGKLFKSFWLIWLLFVPIGFIFYDRTLDGLYGDYAILKLIFQFFGLQDLWGFHGINATWWFYTCIILLYLSFPILNVLSKGWLIVATIFSFCLTFIDVPLLWSIRFYLIAFIAGMWMARIREIPPHLLNNLTFWLSATCVLIFLRECATKLSLYNQVFDWALAIAIVMAYKNLPIMADWIITGLSFIGRHSMNIFLFHTFVYSYYWRDYIFWTHNPFLIFLTLLAVCLVISIMIEALKRSCKNVLLQLRGYREMAR